MINLMKEQEEDVEKFKQIAMEMESEKDNEKKDRIATIFMYEARIKGNCPACPRGILIAYAKFILFIMRGSLIF